MSIFSKRKTINRVTSVAYTAKPYRTAVTPSVIYKNAVSDARKARLTQPTPGYRHHT